MKKIYLTLFLSVFFLVGYSTTFTIVNSGFTFSPATLTINQGDDLIFTLASIHNAIEVSQATWNANGTTLLSGGFSVPFGGGTLSGSQLPVGIHYFVCQNHASMGMKGTITVLSISAVPETKAQNNILIYPNPAKDNLTVQFNPTTTNLVEIKLLNLNGKIINVLYPRANVSGLFLQTFSFNNKLTPGVYFLQISTGEDNTFQKVVIL